jgi:hypothetical protein
VSPDYHFFDENDGECVLVGDCAGTVKAHGGVSEVSVPPEQVPTRQSSLYGLTGSNLQKKIRSEGPVHLYRNRRIRTEMGFVWA